MPASRSRDPTDPLRCPPDYAPYIFFGRTYRTPGEPGALTGASMDRCFHLYLVLDGALDLAAGDERWTLRQGEVAVVEPGCRVTWRQAMTMVHLAFDLVQRPGRGRTLQRQDAPQPSWSTLFGHPLPHRWSREFTDAHREEVIHLAGCRPRLNGDHLINNARLGVLMAGYAVHLSQVDYFDRHGDLGEKRSIGLASRFENCVLEPDGLRRTVAEIADRIGVHPAYLSRAYRRERAASPKDFIRRRRVTVACRLMREDPRRGLAAIAAAVGLRDASGLHQCFRKELGVAPGAWRRAHRSATGSIRA